VIVRGEHAAADARREPRLESAAVAATEPLGVESQRALEGVQAAHLLEVVAIDRHHQRAALAIAGVEARALGQLGGERRPGRRPREVEPQQRLLAELRLGDGREHARRRGARAGADRATVDHAHGVAALGGAPGARQTDDARTDDDHVVPACFRRWGHASCHLLGEVRADRPSAGITRIRFNGRRRASRPLSPVPPSSRTG
jgi:hypothetical protein